MARRKTVVAKTGAELSLEDARTDARKDRPVPSKSTGLLPSLAEWRARRGQLTEADLLALAKSAARLELRGAAYSADDRLDVAASIVAAVLAETAGAMPRRESDRAKLGRLCGDAKNLRRSIDAARERDQKKAAQRATEYAQTAAALGAEPTKAAHVAIVARASVLAAERAASAICAELGLPAETDSPAWSVLYQWARGATGEVCAAERSVTWANWKVRTGRGAKFIRGFYGAAELVSRLTLGAAHDAESDTLIYVSEDASSEAHGHTPLLAAVPSAPHWREPSYPRPADVSEARALCAVSRIKVRPKRERERAKGDRAAETAAALARLGREYAKRSTRERAAARTSALPRVA